MERIIYMGQVNIMAGRRWTEDEVDYILLAHNDNESTVEEVAEFLGRTVSSVRCKSEIINKGKGQFTNASPDGQYTYYINKRKDGTYYLHGASKHYGRT